MCRAYNRWVTDWSADSGGRLIPVAHLSLSDPAAAATELERAVKAGHKGGWVVQFTTTRKPHGHDDHDVLFAKAQELDVPLGIHVSLEPQWCWPGRYDKEYVRKQTVVPQRDCLRRDSPRARELHGSTAPSTNSPSSKS